MIKYLLGRLKEAIFSGFMAVSRIKKIRILGREAAVIAGIRGKDDYDDGWTLALLCNSGDFFDIGCNVGFFTLLSRLLDSRRKTVAADANGKALRATAENLSLNGLAEGVVLIEGFVAERENEEKEFFTVGTGAAGSMFAYHAKTASRMKKTGKVVTTTIDAIVERTGIVPEFVKMDIEGAEQFALRGASKLAVLKKTRFLVEMHSNSSMSMKQNGAAVLGWCRENGYAAYYLKNHEHVNETGPFENRGRCHFLLQPEGWQYPAYLRSIRQSASLEETYAMLQLLKS